MRAVLALLLLAVSGGFGFLGYQAMTPVGAPAPPPAFGASAEEAASGPLDFEPVRATDYSRLAERPLFSAARRPPPPEAPGTPLEDPNDHLLLGRYEVAGVVMLGDAAMAMLRDLDGRLIRVRAGDDVETRTGTAKVTEITLTALTFEEAGEKVVAQIGEPEDGAEGSQGQ